MIATALITKQKYIGDLYGVEVYDQNVAMTVDYMILNIEHRFEIKFTDEQAKELVKLLYPACRKIYYDYIHDNELYYIFACDIEDLQKNPDNSSCNFPYFQEAYDYVKRIVKSNNE